MDVFDVEISAFEIEKTFRVSAKSLDDAENIVMGMPVLDFLKDVKLSNVYTDLSIHLVK